MNISRTEHLTKEWEQYFDRRFAALMQLEAEHWEAAQQRRKMSRKMVANWKTIIHEERKTWLKSWGIGGLHYTQLKTRHLQELQNAQIIEEGEELPRWLLTSESWTQIETEQSVIHNYYKKQGKSVPMPTRRRMVIQIDQYRLCWNGITPEISTNQWRILSDQDLKNEHLCWEDLRIAHSIVMWLYDVVFFRPRSFESRMAFEIEQFWREVDPALNNINRK